jgi:predicted GIY-YIG superfamily endonuclease
MHGNCKWTKELCSIESKRFNTKSEWKLKSPSSYMSSLRNGWHSELCSHMLRLGNKRTRVVYIFTFTDNSVYIGITYNPNLRKLEHLGISKRKKNNSSVLLHIKKTNLLPEFKILSDFIDVNIAIKLEEDLVKKYKKDGFNVLNKVKTGSIGGNIVKWTKENCKIEALKYETKKNFFKFAIGAYLSSKKNGWFDEITSHMKRPEIWNKEWNKSKCFEVSLKCKNKREFRIKYNSAYDASQRNGWLKEIYEKNKW